MNKPGPPGESENQAWSQFVHKSFSICLYHARVSFINSSYYKAIETNKVLCFNQLFHNIRRFLRPPISSPLQVFPQGRRAVKTARLLASAHEQRKPWPSHCLIRAFSVIYCASVTNILHLFRFVSHPYFETRYPDQRKRRQGDGSLSPHFFSCALIKFQKADPHKRASANNSYRRSSPAHLPAHAVWP